MNQPNVVLETTTKPCNSVKLDVMSVIGQSDDIYIVSGVILHQTMGTNSRQMQTPD